MKEGVDGIISRAGLASVPGVWIVKLRFDGLLLGGVGGLMKDGEAGAEGFFSLGATTGRVEVAVHRRLPRELAVLIPRFFRFRAFFAGVTGLASSKKVVGEFSDEPLSVLLDLKSATKDDGAIFAEGDSGDGPGDISVAEELSMVEMVVVGELSSDSDARVDVLSRWTWKAANGTVEELEM